MTSIKPLASNTSQLSDVFVLGAGASVPYGFPTGAKLIQTMRKERFSYGQPENTQILASLGFDGLGIRFQDGSDALRYWEQSGHGRLCNKWTRLIRGSVILTIDQFLKNLEDDKTRELGKRLMARQILASERKSCKNESDVKTDSTFPSMHSLDWIQAFLTRVDLLQNWEEYLRSTVFLTFNYDRVLEFFIERYLVVDKSWPRERARKFIEEDVSIHHMNGHIGSLEQVPFGNLSDETPEFDPLFDPVGKQESHVDWTSISHRMRTVWEDPEHHQSAATTLEKAKEATFKARRIFVIGTSYIPENLEAIGLHSGAGSRTKVWSQTQLACTVSGLSDAQVQRAVLLMGIPQNLAEDHFFKKTANDFIVDHVVF